MQGVYIILNIENEKVYVGSTKNSNRRWKYGHRSLLRNGKHWNSHLQSAWNKYGEKKFKFLLVEEVDNETYLADIEQKWMDFYKSYIRNNGYNICPRADRTKISDETLKKMSRPRGTSGMLGKNHTEETKRKIGEASRKRKRNPVPKEVREKLNRHRVGKTYEEIYGYERAQKIKNKLRAANKKRKYKGGWKLSEETKKKMSKSRIGLPQSKEKRDRCRKSKLGNKNPRYKKIPNSLIKKIIKLYDDGVCRAHIAREVNISEYLVMRLLKERGTL